MVVHTCWPSSLYISIEGNCLFFFWRLPHLTQKWVNIKPDEPTSLGLFSICNFFYSLLIQSIKGGLERIPIGKRLQWHTGAHIFQIAVKQFFAMEANNFCDGYHTANKRIWQIANMVPAHLTSCTEISSTTRFWSTEIPEEGLILTRPRKWACTPVTCTTHTVNHQK